MKILIIRNFPNYMDVRKATYNIQELGLALALSRRNHRVGLILWTDREEEDLLYRDDTAEVMVYYRRATVFLKNGFYKNIGYIIDEYDIIQMAEYNQFQVWQYAQKYQSKLVIYHGQYYGKINRKYNMMCRVFDLFGLYRYRRNETIFLNEYMKRVFICGEMNVPHNTPGANYTQHLAMAFRALGYKVILITNVTVSNRTALNYLYDNKIEIREFTVSKKKLVRGLDYKFLIPRKIRMALRREKPDKDDFIIAYARREDVLNVILEEGRRTGTKTAACIVEWYGREDVGSENEFAKSEYLMEHVYPQFDMIIPISRFIEDFFKKKKCRTVYIPCMADANEYQAREKQYSGKKKIVYPANGKMKDALSGMLEAIIALAPETQNHCEFHFCGVKEEAADKLTQSRIQPLIQQKIVIFHKWMSYDELISLYNEMHFLLLMRNKSRMTLANFPSKVPETMMQAVTPVCTDVGEYTRTYLHDGQDAIIVQDASETTIKNAIQKIADMQWSDVMQLNMNSRVTAINKFDYHCWLDVLKTVVEGGTQ